MWERMVGRPVAQQTLQQEIANTRGPMRAMGVRSRTAVVSGSDGLVKTITAPPRTSGPAP
jgi:hypothetical protein